MEGLKEAICLAAAAFDGQTRKCAGHPAVLHSLEAAVIAQTITDEPEVVIAAVLHDAVEDAGITLEEIRTRFGGRVAALVASETENKRANEKPAATWRIRKEEAVRVIRETKDLGVKALFLSDKLSNMRSMYQAKCTCGADMWNCFNQKDPAQQHWYYSAIAEAMPELQETAAYREYMELIDKTFQEE